MWYYDYNKNISTKFEDKIETTNNNDNNQKFKKYGFTNNDFTHLEYKNQPRRIGFIESAGRKLKKKVKRFIEFVKKKLKKK